VDGRWDGDRIIVTVAYTTGLCRVASVVRYWLMVIHILLS